jgi:hypothetical protein
MTKAQFWRRLDALQQIFRSIVEKLELQKIITKKIYEYLLKYGEYYSHV